jgi:hypothetical protein
MDRLISCRVGVLVGLVVLCGAAARGQQATRRITGHVESDAVVTLGEYEIPPDQPLYDFIKGWHGQTITIEATVTARGEKPLAVATAVIGSVTETSKVRRRASARSLAVATVEKGQEVRIVGAKKLDLWYQVEVKGERGYIRAAFVRVGWPSPSPGGTPVVGFAPPSSDSGPPTVLKWAS